MSIIVGLIVLVAIGVPILTNVTGVMAQYNTTSPSSKSTIIIVLPVLLMAGAILLIVSLYSIVDTK